MMTETKDAREYSRLMEPEKRHRRAPQQSESAEVNKSKSTSRQTSGVGGGTSSNFRYPGTAHENKMDPIRSTLL